MLKTPFWFKSQRPPAGPTQYNIAPAQVSEVGIASMSDIVALYELNADRANADPNTLGLYGTWAGTPGTFATHNGILFDNGFINYLSGGGLQTANWTDTDIDTYYNADGITLSWIARPTPATNGRLMQYWQADLEFIDVFFTDADTLRLSVSLGESTVQSDDVLVDDLDLGDGNFHHLTVTFHPGVGRVARLYVDGTLALETPAVGGTGTFGDVVANVRRGIGFGCAYGAPDTNYSGPVDQVTILKGVFAPIFIAADNRMLYNGFFMRYYSGLMYYTPE